MKYIEPDTPSAAEKSVPKRKPRENGSNARSATYKKRTLSTECYELYRQHFGS